MAAAITASTLTTVCVFLPIVFTRSVITRQLFVDMGLTIGYSLLASLVIALSLVPAMSGGMLKKTTEKPHALLDKMNGLYGKWMEKVLHKKAFVLIWRGSFAGSQRSFGAAKGDGFIPAMESTQASISLTMPEGSSVEETGAMADEVMARLEDLRRYRANGRHGGRKLQHGKQFRCCHGFHLSSAFRG